jgi:choice-of-anchor B domain-containing protein
MKQLFIALFALFFTSLNAQNFNIDFKAEMSFPGETVANIYGFAKEGKEYALVGGSLKTHIVDVTNPTAPTVVASFPFVNSLWKEIRVYKNIAYITTEGAGGGLQIIDLSPLPANTTLPNYRYFGDGVINNQLQTIHALQIDTTKGFIYLYGSNIGQGGAIVCSLADPYNPKYAGRYDLNYIHDGYADNDTLYGGHISDGYFSVIDMTNKTNPVVLATQPTPNTFTHNTWITKDRKHILTTDETPNSYLTMYDISDLGDIKELDRLQCTPGSGSAVHNTYVKGDYAITAWYRDGVNIVDCTRPDNMVQTGWYDTYAGSGAGFDGAWGVYPYLPSGNLIVSNIDPGKIFVLSPTYVRASYLEGKVTNAATGLSIPNAKVVLTTTNPIDNTLSNNQGLYKSGYSGSGQVIVTCSKLGFIAQTITVQLVAGEVLIQDFELQPAPSFTVTGTVKDESGNAIPDAKVRIQEAEADYKTVADANGNFTIPGILSSTYSIYAGKWGFKNVELANQAINSNTTVTLILPKGYKDDFVVDQGWTVSGTSTQGIFELGEPVGLEIQGFFLSQEFDVPTDLGQDCYVTGNQGIGFVDDDVLSGNAVLTSPVMDLTGYVQPKVRFSNAFISITSDQTFTTDQYQVFISNGSNEKLIHTRTSSFDAAWKTITVAVPPNLPLTNNMRLRVVVNEAPTTDFVVTEGAFDAFEIINGTSGTQDIFVEASLLAQPNPFSNTFVLNYTMDTDNGTAIVTNALGQIVQTKSLAAGQTSVTLGENLHSGIYFAWLQTDKGRTKVVSVIKE